MKRTSRRTFIKATTGTVAVASSVPRLMPADSRALDGFQIAARHALVRTIPTPDFFEGMLLGNGDVGVCATVRPDALGLHIGKEDSWDIRVSEEHYREVLPFDRLMELWKRAGEEAKRDGKPDMIHLENSIPELRKYNEKVTESYRKPWPRPWPCGILWIHWDPRKVRLIRQTLDPSCGILTLDLECSDLKGKVWNSQILCLVSWGTNHIHLSSTADVPVDSIAYYPNREKEAGLPDPATTGGVNAGAAWFTCFQHFPALAPSAEQPHPPQSDLDRNFSLHGWVQGEWNLASSAGRQVLSRPGMEAVRVDLTLFTSRDHKDSASHAAGEVLRLSQYPVSRIRQEAEAHWKTFWSRSAVLLQDKELERLWYHNQYFLACCLREGKVAPGLFGNWTSGKIGTAWHGDYHMNYNTQQVFWGVFSSNHADQHLPYVELVESLLPMAEDFAREKMGMPGAFFPHSAYPVPSRTMPYPALPWGYEICETPWTVQSLWWHYLYTQDISYLRRVYPLLLAACRFVSAYLKPEADGKYHVVPTVSPENWGCTVDFRLNRDCIMDLALIAFLLDAGVEASRILSLDSGEAARWRDIRSRLAPYPKIEGPYGEVWLDVLGAPAEFIYNVPVTLAPVFPGEQVGLHSPPEELEFARRSARLVRLEGGNDLVYQPLIRARLGILDLEWFKNEVRYCSLPNGICNDRVRQIGGRYSDQTNPDFMMKMGVWIENLSLPAVLNECMLQSYRGTIRLFPNAEGLGPAQFSGLRTVGAFLVSAVWDGRSVTNLELLSEKGGVVRIVNPWETDKIAVKRLRDSAAIAYRYEKGVLTFNTSAGDRYTLGRA